MVPMNYTQIVLFSFSVWIAAIIGLIRFHKIDQAYYPFILCMWVAALNELLSYSLTKMGAETIINNNIYVLLEALLITWQFKRWDQFEGKARIYLAALLWIIGTAWLFENLLMSAIYKVGFYFRVFYAFVIVLFSINCITWVIFNDSRSLLKDPMFLICAGYIIFFTFKIVTEAFWLSGIKVSNDFSIRVFMAFSWINLFVNILFGIAALCIPPRPHFLSFQ